MEVVMRVFALVVTLVFLSPGLSAAANAGCEDPRKCPAAACRQHDAVHAAFELTEPVEAGIMPAGFEWPSETPERPTREYAKVLFRDPVKVGNRVLIGPYVIEHDEE